MGGSFTVSLIQGKSVEEAIQILANQIDLLIGRVEILETKQIEIETEQAEQEQTISELQTQLVKEETCRRMNELLDELKYQCGISSFPEALTIDECIVKRKQYYYENHLQKELDRANAMLELKPQYLSTKAKCEEKNSE